MIENIIAFSFATLALCISPGPDNIYVLTQSLSNGVRSGIATTAGLISGCIVHTSLLAFGVSAIIRASDPLFYSIKIFGAAYLIYLAYVVFKQKITVKFTNDEAKKNNWKLFKQGVIMNLVNPKVMIFFLAFFPGFLWNESGNTVLQFYILGLTFMFISFITFSSIAILAGNISQFLKSESKTGLYLKWLQIVVFIGIAIFILIP